jgi:Flp pilus assembly protein TadG
MGDQPTITGSLARAQRFGAGQRGQAMVEFALTAPILVLLLFGLVELGNGMNSYLTVLASARDGARLGAQGSASDSDIKNLITVETARLPVTIPSTCSPGTPGMCVSHSTTGGVNSVQVEVCYAHPLILGGLGVIPNPITMCSSTTMRELD